MNRRVFLAAIAAITPMPSVLVGETGWVLLGEKKVSLLAEHDSIELGEDAGEFGKILLKVRGNGLIVRDVTVIYKNGRHDDIPLQARIPENGQTRVIDLRGDSRILRRIDFVYRRPINGKGETIVEVWAQR
jgi:hypothetical protein